ncbi:hypothetical protein C8F01DRAFT_1274717, partial [Mycena amicta]
TAHSPGVCWLESVESVYRGCVIRISLVAGSGPSYSFIFDVTGRTGPDLQDSLHGHHPSSMDSHPIHTLPAELLGQIFVHCLPRPPDPNAFTSVRGLSPQYAPLLLTRVCGLWRDIAHHTPALWSTITLELFSPTPRLDPMLAFWLSHGGQHPLDLYFHYRQRLTTKAIPSLLGASTSRWRDVDLFLHPTALAALSPSARAEYGTEQESVVPDLPHLRRLSLGCLPLPAGARHPEPITLFSNASLLTDVALIKIPPLPARVALPWIQLTSFSVQCADVCASLGVLRLAPALQRLRIQVECPSGGIIAEVQDEDAQHDENPLTMHIHASLESLIIHVHPAAIANTPIRVLLDAYLEFTLPSLRTLVLPVLTAADVPSFAAFAKRVPALESLTMALAPLPPGALSEGLVAFQLSLRVLELRYVAEGSLCELLEKLSEDLNASRDLEDVDVDEDDPAPDTPKPFLPYLQSLHIDSFRSGVPYSALIAALHARARAFTFTMTVLSPRRTRIPILESSAQAPLDALKALKAQGMRIEVELLCDGNGVWEWCKRDCFLLVRWWFSLFSLWVSSESCRILHHFFTPFHSRFVLLHLAITFYSSLSHNTYNIPRTRTVIPYCNSNPITLCIAQYFRRPHEFHPYRTGLRILRRWKLISVHFDDKVEEKCDDI